MKNPDHLIHPNKSHAMNLLPGRRLCFAVFFTALSLTAFSQALTIVHGRIVDAGSDEAMPYVSLKFDGTGLGVVSDINGNFYIETKEKVTTLSVSLVGFKTQTFTVNSGKNTELTIRLEESGNDLKEVVVKSGKYRNRNNPAVELIQKAIDHKDKNRKEALDYYDYEKYEKVQFALNNVTDKMREGFLFRKIKFIFDNVDTNRISGDVSLPFFLRETLSDVYYRKSPQSQDMLPKPLP